MFYLFLPCETPRRYPLGVVIYTYRTKKRWSKKKKKKKTATVLAPAGVNEIQ